MSFDLFFVSSNPHKYREAKQIMASLNVSLGFLESNLQEIQSDSISDIATTKAQAAFSKFDKPVIVEDAGLFIDSLGGFPGPYSSFVFGTIGNKGILNLLKSDRTAKFLSVVAYCDKTTQRHFDGVLHGSIAQSPQGDGWGYDPIFVPDSTNKTLAQSQHKNKISHRYAALVQFTSWWRQYTK